MESVEQVLSICHTIYQMAENVKANKERCQRVAERVKALEGLVLTIKQRGPTQISYTVHNALRELCTTLASAKGLMMKFSQIKGLKSFLKSSGHEEMFYKINEKLTDNFQVLSGALQIEHGNILQRVYETVSGARQGEEYYTSPTSPVPPSNIMPPMPASSPTAPMQPSNIMPSVPASSPTAPMQPSNIMPSVPASSPTAPMLPPNFRLPMQMSSPTSPIPPPNIMPYMQMSSPTAPMPVRCIVPPGSVSIPTGPTIMAPVTNVISRPAFAAVTPTVISSTMAPQPVLSTVAHVRGPMRQMIFPPPNAPVVGYVVNKSYFP